MHVVVTKLETFKAVGHICCEYGSRTKWTKDETLRHSQVRKFHYWRQDASELIRQKSGQYNVLEMK